MAAFLIALHLFHSRCFPDFSHLRSGRDPPLGLRSIWRAAEFLPILSNRSLDPRESQLEVRRAVCPSEGQSCDWPT